MHRSLELKENGTLVAGFYSDHHDKTDSISQDMEKFMAKIKAKKAGNWDWAFEMKKAFIESFPKMITEPIIGDLTEFKVSNKKQTGQNIPVGSD
jgi:hypothetical protein